MSEAGNDQQAGIIVRVLSEGGRLEVFWSHKLALDVVAGGLMLALGFVQRKMMTSRGVAALDEPRVRLAAGPRLDWAEPGKV